MKKVIKKKADKAGKVNKNQVSDQKVAKFVERGNSFGDAIIAMMTASYVTFEDFGVAAFGLAKAYAALKDVANRYDVNVECLFESELSFFDKKYAELSDTEE